MNYWLMKTEPDTFGIDHLMAAAKQTTSWEGVRNYQVRNMLRDDFRLGDLAFFYHSSCAAPGIAGLVEVVREAYPDASAWNPRSPYHDAKSPKNKPLWYTVDVRLKQRAARIVTLATLREHANGPLRELLLLGRGNRLSITPVTGEHWNFILTLMRSR